MEDVTANEVYDRQGRLIRRDVTVAAAPAILKLSQQPAATGTELELRQRLARAEEEAARHAEAAAGFSQTLAALVTAFLDGHGFTGSDEGRWIAIPKEYWDRVEGCLLEQGRLGEDFVVRVSERTKPNGLIAVRGVP